MHIIVKKQAYPLCFVSKKIKLLYRGCSSTQKKMPQIPDNLWRGIYSGSFQSVNRLCLQSGTVCSGKLERIFPSIILSSEFSRIHAKETHKSFDPTKANCCKLVQQRGKTRSSTFQALSFLRIFQQKETYEKRCTGKLSHSAAN